MNVADLAITGILLVSVVVSLWRGLIREAFSILIWVAAIYAAFRFSGALASVFESLIELPSARVILAFSAIFLLVIVVGGLLGYLIGKLVEKSGLSATDRLFGAVFGLARGLAIVVVAVILARLTPFPQDPWWSQSHMLPTFERFADQLNSHLPSAIRELLEKQAGDDRSVAEKVFPTGTSVAPISEDR
ncbi:MAG: CvpA family protein [Xanthomonadaceae bacterium]|nr:CvpA family protein [Xanthomonadaceae bacterium]